MISAAVTLVSVGVCLSVGFWGGKKITNQLDYLGYLAKEALKKKKQ